jgi:hypothetical protein
MPPDQSKLRENLYQSWKHITASADYVGVYAFREIHVFFLYSQPLPNKAIMVQLPKDLVYVQDQLVQR